MPSFSKSSQDKLDTCHPDLIRLFNEVVKRTDCSILEGHRTMERQKELFRDGKSKTLGSKHLTQPSVAVDVMPYPIKWEDTLGQHKFAVTVLQTALEMGIKVKWGGTWRSFYDSPHYQLIGE